MKTIRKGKSYGERLAALRNERGITMRELAKKLGISLRRYFLFEKKPNALLTHILPAVCQELNISTDELLGLKHMRKTIEPARVALWQKLRRTEELPVKDQKALLEFLNALLKKNRKP